MTVPSRSHREFVAFLAQQVARIRETLHPSRRDQLALEADTLTVKTGVATRRIDLPDDDER